MRPISFFNPEKKLACVDGQQIHWQALTTGNFGGFDIWLEEACGGMLEFETPLLKSSVPLENIGYQDKIFDNSGKLPRFMHLVRLPSENRYRSIVINREINLRQEGDNPIFVKLIQEDGHVAWSSPIYFFQN